MKCPVCKKDIPKTALKCPYCKTRIGVLCSNCETINPIGSSNCTKCGKELLKVCKHCNSVNFPGAIKCRKCGSVFSSNIEDEQTAELLKYQPKYTPISKCVQIFEEQLKSKTKKLFSISGTKGCGKTTVLNKVIENTKDFQWCIGRCSSLTQVTPGGAIQDMMLNLFNLPLYAIEDRELKEKALKFFSKEFRFLNKDETEFFFNFIYNCQDGNYEDIIINKKRTFSILNKIFTAFVNTGKFIFAIDNFDFIDGFSIEIISDLVKTNAKNLKLILIYNEPRPVNSFFDYAQINAENSFDLNIAQFSLNDYKNMLGTVPEWSGVTAREKEIIYRKSSGNPAYIEQALSYSFDCQISDKAFILPNTFNELIKIRLETLSKINNDAYKILCGSAILGYRVNYNVIKDIFGYSDKHFEQIMQYLVKSRFLKSGELYEFSSLILWEIILKNITKTPEFNDINVKIGKAISVFTINIHAPMAMIAYNLKENRLAFDIWTKITRLASYVGDINLYVIAQRQCLALINEFNESETLNIRYNISERLGKLLTMYDPTEAIEFLPDAISHAREINNEVKEIELLGYLAVCCDKTGNNFGKIECADNILKKIETKDSIETALVKTSKLPAIINIGNCYETVNMIDNDIMPKLTSYLVKPQLNKILPPGLIFETKLKVQLALAKALALSGDDRSFEVLTNLFTAIERNRITDTSLICEAKLILAIANTMKGNYSTCEDLLGDIDRKYRKEFMDNMSISHWNLIYIINKFMKRDYTGIRETLFDSVTFANNIGDDFTKNILKALLGKTLKDARKSKQAIGIYDEQAMYFAKEKNAIGALLCWYLIADAEISTENPKNAISVAVQALEIANNPKISNKFFITLLNIVLAKAYIELSDFETAKMYIETAVSNAKKHNLNDLLSRAYLQYGICFREVGSVNSNKQLEFLKAAKNMFEKAFEITYKQTKNPYIKEEIEKQKSILMSYCDVNGISIDN